MRNLILFTLCFSAYSNCLEDYKTSFELKMTKYNKRIQRYEENRNNAIFSKDILISVIGSKLERPTKENIYEEEVLFSAGIGYKYKTKAVMDIYNQLRPVHPFITPELVQVEFNDGLVSGDFCKGIFGKYRIGKAKKYVLKKLKSKRDIAKIEDVKVNDDQIIKVKDNTSVVKPKYKAKQE